MKININFTVEIDAKIIREYMAELGASDESTQYFVRSHMIASGIGVLEDSLANSGYNHEPIQITKGNY